jgi:hypothetical protein
VGLGCLEVGSWRVAGSDGDVGREVGVGAMSMAWKGGLLWWWCEGEVYCSGIWSPWRHIGLASLCSGDVVTVKCRAVEGDDAVFDSNAVACADDRHWLVALVRSLEALFFGGGFLFLNCHSQTNITGFTSPVFEPLYALLSEVGR